MIRRLLIAVLFAVSAAAVWADPVELMVQGNQFVSTASGCTIILRGVNTDSLEYNSAGSDGGACGSIYGMVTGAVTIWRSNLIRVPLSQDFWFGVGNAKDANPNQEMYRSIVDAIVDNCRTRNVYCLLDLHWSGTGTWGTAAQQENMPDDHSTDFWISVASRYANNPAVMFDLYNEPKSVSWDVWRDGGNAGTFHTPGLQALLETIRGVGAKNIVVAGGLDWGYDLTGVPAYALTDTAGGRGVAYSSHIYPWKGNPYWIPAGGDSKIKPAGDLYPIIIGEFGQNATDATSCSACQDASFPGYSTGAWVTTVLNWIAQRGYSYAAWDFHRNSSPVLVSDCAFNATVHNGLPVSQNLAAAVTVAGCPSDFTPVLTESPTATDTPTVTATGTLPTMTFTITRTPTITMTVTPTPVSTICTTVFNGGETLDENGLWLGNNANITVVDSSGAPPGAITQGSKCVKVDVVVGLGWNNQVLNLTGAFNPKSWGGEYRMILDVYADPAFIAASGSWHQLFFRVDSGAQTGKAITSPNMYSLNAGANNNLTFTLSFGGSNIAPSDDLDMLYFIYNSQNGATANGALYVDNIRLVRGCVFSPTPTVTDTGTPTDTLTPTPTGTWVTDTPTPTETFTPTPTDTPGNLALGVPLAYPNPYPYPTPDVPGGDMLKVWVDTGNDGPKDVTLKVYTTSFRRVLTREYPMQSTGVVVLGDVDDKLVPLSSGLYYLVAEDKKGNRAIGKLIIRR